MKGRQRFRCKRCDILIEGRMLPDGRVVAYDRGPYDGSPERSAVCADCIVRGAETAPEVR